MRRFFLTASLLAFTLFSAHSQTNNVTARLKLFIKAWGFLKYHHPQVAAGSLDWDSVFVNNVQGMIDATKPTDFNEKLLNVIGAAGKPILTNLPKAPGGLFEQNKTGVGWIQKASLFFRCG